jgi:chromosome segregation protein
LNGEVDLVYLRKIVLRGFKSFGKRTVSLRFSNGLTTVVGANGSGKSNVLDAICFTLGILSAKLVRAGSFSDLIYNPGSPSTEKPAEYARVTLHFDNSDRRIPVDTDDIVMSRQVDRQGHGVYRLNGRLTTRTEMMDVLSMVGIDPEGYNIVPQGELGRIIRLSQDERRQLIEKIAGIATYDEKRERALKELEEANQNLQRVGDLVRLVREEFQRLEKEKEGATRWQNIDKEIRNLQGSLVYTQLTRARLALDEVSKKLETKKSELDKLKADQDTTTSTHDNLSNRITEIERSLTSLESELETTQFRILELRQQISETGSASNLIQEKIRSNSSQLKALEEKLPSLKKTTDNAWNEVRLLDDRKKSLLRTIDDITLTIKELSTQISGLDEEFDKKRQQLDNTVSNVNELNSELARTNAKQQILTREETYLQQEISKLAKSKEDSENSHTAIKNDMDLLKKEQEDSLNTLANVKGDSERLSRELTSTEKQLEETDTIIKKIRDELIRIQAKMDALREVRMHLSHGRRAAITEILKLKAQGSAHGIYGIIADLIKVPPEYSIAIEASAGYRLSYVVTKTEDDAAKLVEILKKNKTGRASFVPLDSLKTGTPIECPKDKGIIGFAKDLISYNKEIEPAVEYVFGRTVVVRDLEVARSLKHTQLRRVTLDGDIIEPTGLITGGFYRKGIKTDERLNLPRREEELKGIEETRRTLSDKMQRLRTLKSDSSESINTSERKLEVTGVQLSEKNNKANELEQTIRRTENEIESKSERLEEVTKELANLENTIEESKNRLTSLTSQERKLRTLLDTSDASKIGIIIENKKNELVRLNDELKKVEISIAQNMGKIEQLTPQTEEAKKLIDEARNMVPSLQSDLEAKQAKLDVLNDELHNVSSERERLKGEADKFRKELTEKKAASRESSKKLNAVREEINALQMDASGLNIRKEDLGSEIASLEKRIQEFPEFQSPSTQENDEEEITERIRILKEEQTALGSVNMKAIEQYDSTKSKYDEAISRRDKVLQEKTAILEFMEKLEREKVKKFMETFNDISNNFREIFDYLSPSIRAELTVENPEQPLLGGIAIKVRTAGMEVANIEALSGGEKSLTALALIFAIQKHQPAPFYVMDEIDAFLDEVNAVRVADLLKELSKNSQFIVVTLKQAVMTRADSLIGISKNAETGISNIVSANIEEFTMQAAM